MIWQDTSPSRGGALKRPRRRSSNETQDPNQADFSGMTIGAKDEIGRKEYEIAELESDLEFISHVRDCEICMVECRLDVVRYYGRCSPWFLSTEDMIYDDIPDPSNYDFGFYPHENREEGKRFILDRFAWVEPRIKSEISKLRSEIEDLKKKSSLCW